VKDWHRKGILHTAAGTLAALMAFTQPFEGMAYQAYQHRGDVPTICAGHTAGVHLGDVAGHAECLQYLAEDEAAALKEVDRDINTPISDFQRIAFADFVFNDGAGNFRRSSMLRLANDGDIVGACNALLKWDRASGHVLPGLVRRRQAERDLCMRGI
jgi:lysozyme